ncbi:hypothetical protein O6P43_014885 [Quillaja saponaria]|uniref:Uncharacterized protein n=1 Tax=Quillaja saponaria TaxID=32244 RepID=A0AAD7LVM5_QUISA|nr:hypothetical protein O6P43_014885 [Quillaja saponaria]
MIREPDNTVLLTESSFRSHPPTMHWRVDRVAYKSRLFIRNLHSLVLLFLTVTMEQASIIIRMDSGPCPAAHTQWKKL